MWIVEVASSMDMNVISKFKFESKEKAEAFARLRSETSSHVLDIYEQ